MFINCATSEDIEIYFQDQEYRVTLSSDKLRYTSDQSILNLIDHFTLTDDVFLDLPVNCRLHHVLLNLIEEPSQETIQKFLDRNDYGFNQPLTDYMNLCLKHIKSG